MMTKKTAADTIFGVYGLNFEAAVNEFIATVIKQKNIPFLKTDSKQDSNTEKERIKQKRLKAKGSLRGKVWMADDFDAPLEEMKEYIGQYEEGFN
jgi:antitoxin component of RelBE/YafQ-DinJ toxin-antitoxin module